MKHYLILLVGLAGAASSVFFIKKADGFGPCSLAAARLLLSALFLSPFAIRNLRQRGRSLDRTDLIATVPGALLFAIHFATWFVGVRETSAAMSALIVNLVPVLMPFFVWWLLRERLNFGEFVGSLVAISGVVLLAVGKDDTGITTLQGVIWCVVSMTFCTGYLAMGRRFGAGRNLFVYIVPLYAIAGVLSVGFAVLTRERLPTIDLRQALLVLGAVIFPTVIGHTALNHAMVHLPSQFVSISNLAQFAFVAVLAAPILGEYPSIRLALPASLVLAGALIVIRTAPRKVQKQLDRVATEPAGT